MCEAMSKLSYLAIVFCVVGPPVGITPADEPIELPDRYAEVVLSVDGMI